MTVRGISNIILCSLETECFLIDVTRRCTDDRPGYVNICHDICPVAINVVGDPKSVGIGGKHLMKFSIGNLRKTIKRLENS